MSGTSDASEKGGKPKAESPREWTREQLLARIGKLTAATLVAATGWGTQEKAAAQNPSASARASASAPATASPSVQNYPATASPSAPEAGGQNAPAPASAPAQASPARGAANGNGAPANGNGSHADGERKPKGGANGTGGCVIVGAVVVCGSATVVWLNL